MAEHFERLESILEQISGFIYPNEIELHWGLLVVLYPYITGLVAGAFILASLEKVFRVKEIEPTYRLAMLTAWPSCSWRRCRCWLIWDIPSDPSRSSCTPSSRRRWPCSGSSTPGI